MVAIAEGHVVSVGQEVLLLAGEGRIREDYQFVAPAG